MKKVILGLMGTLEIETKDKEDVALISLKGQLDASTAEEVNNIVKGFLDKGILKIAADLTDVTYIDSSALAVLIFVNSSLQTKGEVLRIIGLKGKPKEVFDLANVTQLFKVCEDEKEAFASFG